MSTAPLAAEATLDDLTKQSSEQPSEPVLPVAPPQQDNINRAKLPEPLLDNPNITDCVPSAPQQPDVCVHDVDNCNQPQRKTVQTPQMG